MSPRLVLPPLAVLCVVLFALIQITPAGELGLTFAILAVCWISACIGYAAVAWLVHRTA